MAGDKVRVEWLITHEIKYVYDEFLWFSVAKYPTPKITKSCSKFSQAQPHNVGTNIIGVTYSVSKNVPSLVCSMPILTSEP